MGGSIGLAIALGLKRAPLVTISAVAVGALGYQFGGPIGAYLASIVGVEAGSLVSKRTPVDIIITPLLAVVAGGLFAKYCCAPVNEWVMSLGEVINRATMLNPFIMGIVVSVSVGCIDASDQFGRSLHIDRHRWTCSRCCNGRMLRSDDRFRSHQLQGQWTGRTGIAGLGTSMLQVGNIARKPIIWLAPTTTSAILGPVSTMWLKMTNNAAGAGMGTAGLVGPLGCWDTMAATTDHGILLAEIIGLYFIAPALRAFASTSS